MVAAADETGFSLASFDFDGRFNGVQHWRFDQLSEHWLEVCRTFLDHHGDSFKASWTGALSHIATHFTAAAGAGLFTSLVDGQIALSSTLLGGRSEEADKWVLSSFVDSMRGVDLVRQAAPEPEPFREVFDVDQRPLMATVVWGDGQISDQDYELVIELERHLAGAFFLAARVK